MRELDSSANAGAALALSKTQEETKQLELRARMEQVAFIFVQSLICALF